MQCSLSVEYCAYKEYINTQLNVFSGVSQRANQQESLSPKGLKLFIVVLMTSSSRNNKNSLCDILREDTEPNMEPELKLLGSLLLRANQNDSWSDEVTYKNAVYKAAVSDLINVDLSRHRHAVNILVACCPLDVSLHNMWISSRMFL